MTGSDDIFHPFGFEKSKGTPDKSPHFHLIAFGWIDGNKVGEAYRKTGMFVKKICTLKKEDQYFATSKYLLTHAGVKPGTHAVAYTGSVHYGKLFIPEEEVESPKCPYCDLGLQNLRVSPRVLDRPPDFEPGFEGLTDYPHLEIIEDYDQHYYD